MADGPSAVVADNPQAMIARAREMLAARGAPNTAENLNRAMQMIHGSDDRPTDFDYMLEQADNPSARGSQPRRSGSQSARSGRGMNGEQQGGPVPTKPEQASVASARGGDDASIMDRINEVVGGDNPGQPAPPPAPPAPPGVPSPDGPPLPQAPPTVEAPPPPQGVPSPQAPPSVDAPPQPPPVSTGDAVSQNAGRPGLPSGADLANDPTVRMITELLMGSGGAGAGRIPNAALSLRGAEQGAVAGPPRAALYAPYTRMANDGANVVRGPERIAGRGAALPTPPARLAPPAGPAQISGPAQSPARANRLLDDSSPQAEIQRRVTELLRRREKAPVGAQ